MATEAAFASVDALRHPYRAEHSLPADVLNILPSDPFLALELAYKISCHAYTQQVSRLESEAQQMQSALSQNQQLIKSLERRIASMETEMQEHQQRARHSLTEQHKLLAEKNALIETVKRLNREVAKLEHFKKNLLQQLQDDSEADVAGFVPSLAAVDLTTERLVSQVLQSADAIAAAGQQQQQQPAAAGVGAAATATAAFAAAAGQQQPGQQQQQLSAPEAAAGAGAGGGAAAAGQQQQAGLSPSKGLAGSLKMMGISAVGGSPGSGAYISAVNSHNSSGKAAAAGGGGAAAVAGGLAAGQQQQQQQQHFGSSGGSSVAPASGRLSSPPASTAAAMGRAVVGSAGGGLSRAAGSAGGAGGYVSEGGASRTSPRVDGKEFFRQARARLSYEQFSQFLVTIKELNAGRASREDTLEAARGLFGPHNGDLYGLFEGLIMRHLTGL